MVEVGSFEELEALGREGVEGKIVFYNTYMDHSLISTFNAYGGAVKYRWAGAMEAGKYGAIATVLRSVTLLRDQMMLNYNNVENALRYTEGHAKRIRFRFSDDKIIALEKLKWWNRDFMWLERNYHLFSNVDELIECV